MIPQALKVPALKTVHTNAITRTTKVKPRGSVKWAAPPSGWTKLNTDGVSKGNPGPAGGGGVFRDSTGSFLQAYTFHCGDSSALTAEVWAILHGLQMVIRLGYPRLIVESDSEILCELLRSRKPDTNANFHLVEQCRRLIDGSPWERKMNNIRRTANGAADDLANWSLHLLHSFEEHHVIPDCIRSALSFDVSPLGQN